MNASEEKQKSDASAALLQANDVPIGAPLEWPIFDAGGVLLFERGATLSQAEDRAFLFQHFQPYRGGSDTQAAASSNEDTATQQEPLSIKDLDLTIGMSLGIRPQAGAGGAMQASKLIGLAQNNALFVMSPLRVGQQRPFHQGEQIEVVAVSDRAVCLFVCTIDTVCTAPFSYLILSEPGAIRRLRSRKSVRTRVKLAVKYAVAATGGSNEGLGIGYNISPLGMSLATSVELGQLGTRLRVGFRIKTDEFNLDIESIATVRNVQKSEPPDGLIVHGLEFDRLESAQQIALKCFILDQS
ncbi:MAG: pilZ domain protein [Herbaspirillum sp.]|nr:pilZ domain protein [Herbaspirillum sp.]